MIAVIREYNNKLFSYNGIKYVRNFQAIKVGDKVRISNAYDSKFTLCVAHYSEYTLNGLLFLSADNLVSALSPVLFVKDELSMVAPSEAGNSTVEAVFHNIYGEWINSPSDPITSSINFDMTSAVNAGICAVYYKGAVISEATFPDATGLIPLISGSNVLDELCVAWIIYNKGNGSFLVNIQTGATGTIPDPPDNTPLAPSISISIEEITTGDVPLAPSIAISEETIGSSPLAPSITLTEETI